ncbi:DsbA family oxidoreductase [Piscinibacter sp.]|jgi:predicted DsbA family dithiol-disulfide isomerase|uniref:DsbA family oxidoreductase n=1 Tax=Piscinibacter sp. TaxID=1903157 RepID=UPI003559D06A
MKIDFVSDVACPWCGVGLNSLERALERIGDSIDVDLHFRPFELNPQMEREGEDAAEHLARKYGLTPQQLERNRAMIRQRGADVGFEFGDRTRVWNTFDAHRLLYWAGLEGRQRELKHALLRSYHGRGENPGAHEVLLKLAREVGLDVERARDVLESGRYAAEVRAEERHWQELGIHSVPSVIVNDRHLIQGGQPPDVFERALRQLVNVPA